jgi:UDP-N-acetylglucosamine--N-acetylmuramyl-(pentapeptide) pyrophosphoryl-undecaprenol N-acetylglucosamine transferase
MEMEKVPQAGYRIEGLDIAGLNRSSLIKNIGLPFKLLKSFYQVRKIFTDFQPDAVIGVGGYSSFPVLRLAQAKEFPHLFTNPIRLQVSRTFCLEKKLPEYLLLQMAWRNFFRQERSWSRETQSGRP